MRLGWGLSSPAPDAAQQECCEPGSTLLCMGLFSRFFVQALPCTAEGTLCRVRDTRSLVPRAYRTNRSNSNTSCSSCHRAARSADPVAGDDDRCAGDVILNRRALERGVDHLCQCFELERLLQCRAVAIFFRKTR